MRRELSAAVHGDGEVAAARTLLGSAAHVARPGGSSARQHAGEEEQSDAWVPAHGELMAGMAGKTPAGGAVGGRRREQSREVGDGDKGRFAISKNSRDYSVN